MSKRLFIHLGLFVITFITTLIAGVEWTTGKPGPYELSFLLNGLTYAIAILFFLTVHEFGHYFAARYHKVEVTFPYYIPFPPLPGFFNFGTMGAVIKTKSPVRNNIAMFDIGASGPIAGFIACIIILAYGFSNLPPADYILTIHPDYFSPEYGKDAISLRFGDTLLFSFMRLLFTSPGDFVPPMSEIYHYPFLCTGWFGLFVTAMNLIPVGQLDGGHIAYSMFGEKKHEAIASISMIILIFLGVSGLIDSFLELGLGFGWSGWLFWSFVLYFFIRVKHPPVWEYNKLDSRRKIIGYIAFVVLLMSFSPVPFEITF
ncbi:MAG: site-2 protease family protein [Ignavibacteriales bacterium]|nr:site-2 protease family protein [Ignavibacteriales bacterium]MCF8435760.1 site-2 protease family protein [Ignavibacteriales bacterium]